MAERNRRQRSSEADLREKRNQMRAMKSICCLVITMACGAGMLSLAEPASLLSPTTGIPDLACTPGQAVHDVRADRPGDWRQVVVHRGAGVETLPAGIRYHFLVRQDGNVLASAAWRLQAPIGADTQDVHIGLVPAGSDLLIPRLQWNALADLLDRLRTRCQLDAGRITWARTSPLPFPDTMDAGREPLGSVLLSMGFDF